MEWLNIKEHKPKESEDILVTDGERQWVATYFKGIFIASHPDYKRYENNEYGCPYFVHSRPTHWAVLPPFPK